MAGEQLDNAAPTVFESSKGREITDADFDDEVEDPIDQREIFGMSFICEKQRCGLCCLFFPLPSLCSRACVYLL